MLFTGKWMELENHLKWSQQGTERQRSHGFKCRHYRIYIQIYTLHVSNRLLEKDQGGGIEEKNMNDD
jgi:hypothetical protein